MLLNIVCLMGTVSVFSCSFSATVWACSCTSGTFVMGTSGEQQERPSSWWMSGRCVLLLPPPPPLLFCSSLLQPAAARCPEEPGGTRRNPQQTQGETRVGSLTRVFSLFASLCSVCVCGATTGLQTIEEHAAPPLPPGRSAAAAASFRVMKPATTLLPPPPPPVFNYYYPHLIYLFLQIPLTPSEQVATTTPASWQIRRRSSWEERTLICGSVT